MNEIEERLRQTLQQAANRVPPHPAELKGSLQRRIRTLQSVYLVVALIVASAAAVGIASGVSRATRSNVPGEAVGTIAPQLIYVIDGAPGGKASKAGVVAVRADSSTFQVVGRYPLGSDPDVALSPDGSRLYGVAFVWLSDAQTDDRLRVFDTATGDLISEVGVPDWQGTTGFHITNKIAVSRDGGLVFVLVGFAEGAPGRPQSLATFDSVDDTMLPNVAPLDDCGSGPSILPLAEPNVVVVCRRFAEVRFLQISDSGQLANEMRLSLPVKAGSGAGDTSYISQAVLSPDASTLYAVTRGGQVFVVDVATHQVVRAVDLDLAVGSYVVVPQVKISSDGGALYLGLGGQTDALQGDSVLRVDTATWQDRDLVATDAFSAFELSSDGSRLFTIRDGSSVLDQVALESSVRLEPLGTVADEPKAIYVSP